MSNIIINKDAVEVPNYKVVLLADGVDRVIGKVNVDAEGNLDTSTVYDTMNVFHTMLPTDKGLMQFLTFNIEGIMIEIPENVRITILDRGTLYYKEYMKLISGIVEPDKSIKLR